MAYNSRKSQYGGHQQNRSRKQQKVEDETDAFLRLVRGLSLL